MDIMGKNSKKGKKGKKGKNNQGENNLSNNPLETSNNSGQPYVATVVHPSLGGEASKPSDTSPKQSDSVQEGDGNTNVNSAIIPGLNTHKVNSEGSVQPDHQPIPVATEREVLEQAPKSPIQALNDHLEKLYAKYWFAGKAPNVSELLGLNSENAETDQKKINQKIEAAQEQREYLNKMSQMIADCQRHQIAVDPTITEQLRIATLGTDFQLDYLHQNDFNPRKYQELILVSEKKKGGMFRRSVTGSWQKSQSSANELQNEEYRKMIELFQKYIYVRDHLTEIEKAMVTQSTVTAEEKNKAKSNLSNLRKAYHEVQRLLMANGVQVRGSVTTIVTGKGQKTMDSSHLSTALESLDTAYRALPQRVTFDLAAVRKYYQEVDAEYNKDLQIFGTKVDENEEKSKLGTLKEYGSSIGDLGAWISSSDGNDAGPSHDAIEQIKFFKEAVEEARNAWHAEKKKNATTWQSVRSAVSDFGHWFFSGEQSQSHKLQQVIEILKKNPNGSYEDVFTALYQVAGPKISEGETPSANNGQYAKINRKPVVDLLSDLGFRHLAQLIEENAINSTQEKLHAAINEELQRHQTAQTIRESYQEMQKQLDNLKKIAKESQSNQDYTGGDAERKDIQKNLADVSSEVSAMIQLKNEFEQEIQAIAETRVKLIGKKHQPARDALIAKLEGKIESRLGLLEAVCKEFKGEQAFLTGKIKEKKIDFSNLAHKEKEASDNYEKVLQSGEQAQSEFEGVQAVENAQSANRNLKKARSSKVQVHSETMQLAIRKDRSDVFIKSVEEAQSALTTYRDRKTEYADSDRLSHLQHVLQKTFEAMSVHHMGKAESSTDVALEKYRKEQDENVDRLIEKMNTEVENIKTAYPILSLSGGVLSSYSHSDMPDAISESVVMKAAQEKIQLRNQIEGEKGNPTPDQEKIKALEEALHRNSQVIAKGLLKAYSRIFRDANGELALSHVYNIWSQNSDIHQKTDKTTQRKDFDNMWEQALFGALPALYQNSGGGLQHKLWKALLSQEEFAEMWGEKVRSINQFDLNTKPSEKRPNDDSQRNSNETMAVLEEITTTLRKSFSSEGGVDQEDKKAFYDEIQRQLEVMKPHAINKDSTGNMLEGESRYPHVVDLEKLRQFDESIHHFMIAAQEKAWSLTSGSESSAKFEAGFQAALKALKQKRNALIELQIDAYDSTLTQAAKDKIKDEIQRLAPLNFSVMLQEKTVSLTDDGITLDNVNKSSFQYRLKSLIWAVKALCMRIGVMFLGMKDQVDDRQVQRLKDQHAVLVQHMESAAKHIESTQNATHSGLGVRVQALTFKPATVADEKENKPKNS